MTTSISKFPKCAVTFWEFFFTRAIGDEYSCWIIFGTSEYFLQLCAQKKQTAYNIMRIRMHGQTCYQTWRLLFVKIYTHLRQMIKARVLISTGFSPLSREMHANPISHRVYIFIYMHQSWSFLRRRAKVGYWGKRLRKAIRKLQKPNSKRWEKGRILKSLGEWNMSLQEPVRR